jgi:hypothetical protein
MGIISKRSTICIAEQRVAAPASKPIATQIASWPVEYFSSRSCGAAALLAMRLTRFSRSLRTAWLRYTLNRLRIERVGYRLKITLRKRLGTVSMASIASYQFPDAESWPLIMNGYETISSNLIETSSGREMGLSVCDASSYLCLKRVRL